MKICNYEVKIIILNPALVVSDFPINNNIAFNIKENLTLRVYCEIQYYLWSKDKVPEIKDLGAKFIVSNKEIEKHIAILHQQHKLVFYVKE